MPNHKSEDYKLSAIDYYLTEDTSQEEVCKIFKCSTRSLMRILYAVPYQHFTNSIENYFSMLKSRLYKESEEGEGLTHQKLKANITSVI